MMDPEILDSIFKAYDIRGKYPEELSTDFYYDLGKAYVTKYKPTRLVVGHDIRPESLELKHALIEGILDSGCNVTDIGEVATEMLYFAVGEYYQLFDGGLIVTASHNPAGWNGCKLVKKGVAPVMKATGLDELKKIILSGSFVTGSRGALDELDVFPAYKEKVLSFITTDKRKELHIIVDAGNGIGGTIFDYVFGDMNLNVKRMYFVPDGTYPNHVPNPLIEMNVAELKQEVLENNADFGIAIDGDADRVVFIDSKGRRPDGVYTGVTLARNLLSRSENKRVIHDTRVTWPFEKECKKIGAETAPCIAGHSYFKKKMIDEDAVFGAEMSSHYFYKDFYNADSGMVTIAIMLNMYFEGFELAKELDYLFDTYPNSGEVNYRVDDASAMIEKVKEHYSVLHGIIDELDGVTVEFDDWRLSLRKSNTEPLIRLNVEAVDKNLVVEKFLEVESLIGFPRDNPPALPELL